MNRFIQLTNNTKALRKVLNITSGASINSYDGWGMYCGSKAGIDLITQVLIEEINQKIAETR